MDPGTDHGTDTMGEISSVSTFADRQYRRGDPQPSRHYSLTFTLEGPSRLDTHHTLRGSDTRSAQITQCSLMHGTARTTPVMAGFSAPAAVARWTRRGAAHVPQPFRHALVAACGRALRILSTPPYIGLPPPAPLRPRARRIISHRLGCRQACLCGHGRRASDYCAAAPCEEGEMREGERRGRGDGCGCGCWCSGPEISHPSGICDSLPSLLKCQETICDVSQTSEISHSPLGYLGST